MAADSVPEFLPKLRNSGVVDQTVRHIAHISIAGKRVRVRLSNAYGKGPLVIGAAHIALQGAGSSILAQSDRALTFNGNRSITIPAGALALSDPVALDMPAFADVAVSVYFPGNTGPLTWHQLGAQTAYISTPGDYTASAVMPVAATEASRYALADVEVAAAKTVTAVVALGDSITDGYCSSLDANRRWPDVLSARLNGKTGTKGMAVLNQGISGTTASAPTPWRDSIATCWPRRASRM
jgi:hypothetical protein